VMRRLLPWLAAAGVVLLDRVSKGMVLRCIVPGTVIPVVPGLGLTNVHNTGIAFSLFADGSALTRGILQLVILGAVVFIAWTITRQDRTAPVTALGLGLILGGALGNLLDRALYGWVIDFIHLSARIGGTVYSWPDFNLADSAISVGAAVLIVRELWRPKERRHAPDPD